MWNRRKTLALGVASLAGVAAGDIPPALVRAQQEPGSISLMESIAEWKYPEATILGGASMSDGGNPEIADLTCKAILTTSDAFEDVVRFYATLAGGATPEKAAQAKAVVTQVDSKNRPIQLRVFSVHKADRSDTLVISRGEGEKLTHIAWSQYRRFSVPKGR